MRREHVENIIKTLEDHNLSEQVTLLRLMSSDDMDETMRAYQRMEVRVSKAPMELSKFRPRSEFSSRPTPSKSTRAVRAVQVQEGDSNISDLASSGSNVDAY